MCVLEEGSLEDERELHLWVDPLFAVQRPPLAPLSAAQSFCSSSGDEPVSCAWKDGVSMPTSTTAVQSAMIVTDVVGGGFARSSICCLLALFHLEGEGMSPCGGQGPRCGCYFTM